MAVMRRALLMLVVLVAVTVSTAPSIQAHANKKPDVTPATWIECQYTTETDNIFVGNGSRNPYVDYVHADPSSGNEWDVYYDIQRDSTNGVACNMRVVVRIFPPSGGSWA